MSGHAHGLSETAEMYLKRLAELGGTLDDVPVPRLAQRLGVTVVSANEMIHRLAEQGWLTHTPYRGARLTGAGRELAQGVIRRQRLWEVFLHERLNLPVAEVETLACELEHATPPQVVAALDRYLEHPAVCPHGHPIPTAENVNAALTGTTLDRLSAGASGTVLQVLSDDEQTYTFFEARGLRVGASFRVIATTPVHGPISVEVAGQPIALAVSLAAMVRVVETQRARLPLSHLDAGESGVITAIGGSAALRRRFSEMGLVKGERITAERVAPLGDPVAYYLKGYRLSLRREEAEQVTIMKDDPC